MRSSTQIIGDAYWQISAEIQATLRYRTSLDHQGDVAILAARHAKAARSELLHILHDAAKLKDIDTLLELESIFLVRELESLAESPEKESSLENGVEELEAARIVLASVRDQDSYRHFAQQHFTLPKFRIGHLPKDQARQFFESHLTRLGNLQRARMEGNERDVISARIENIRIARSLYVNLQEQAMAPHDIREPSDCYITALDFPRIANCA